MKNANYIAFDSEKIELKGKKKSNYKLSQTDLGIVGRFKIEVNKTDTFCMKLPLSRN